MLERWRPWSVVQAWTSCRVQVFPCAVCRTGVGSNSIFCNGCKYCVLKKCSQLKHLTKDPDYRCIQCQGTASPLNGRPQREVQVGPDKLEVIAYFCYLEDVLSAAGGCELLTTTRMKTAWKKFKELLSVCSSSHLSFKTHGRVYSSCVQSVILNASETWPLTKPNLKSAAEWQGNDQTDLQCQAARHCRHQIQWATCVAWHWGSGPHSEGEKTSMVSTCGTLQWCSQDSLWHTGWWKAWAWEAQDDKEAADREELQRVEALSYQPSW